MSSSSRAIVLLIIVGLFAGAGYFFYVELNKKTDINLERKEALQARRAKKSNWDQNDAATINFFVIVSDQWRLFVLLQLARLRQK